MVSTLPQLIQCKSLLWKRSATGKPEGKANSTTNIIVRGKMLHNVYQQSH